jgi:hypothetical protein
MQEVLSTYPLQHAGTLADLRRHILVEQGLHENENGAVLGLDTELLGFDVDIDVVDLVNATLLLGLLLNPFTQLVVDSVTTALALLIIVVAIQDELCLEVTRKGPLTSLDGLFTHVDSPVVIIDFDVAVFTETLGLGLDLAGHGVVIAGILELLVDVVSVGRGLVRVVIAASAVLLVTVGLGLAGGLTLSLVLLAFLGLVLQNKATKLQTQVDVGALAASLAVKRDVAVLDLDIGLRVLALLAENKLVDETVKVILKLGRVVGSIDDPAIIGWVNVGLSPELETEVLDQVRPGPGKRLSNAAEVDNHGLDAVALAFDLGLKGLHLVAIEGIGVVPTDIDKTTRHVGGVFARSSCLNEAGRRHTTSVAESEIEARSS